MRHLLSSILFVFTLLATSCISDETLQNSEAIVYENPMKVIGELHNEGVALIMKEFNSIPNTRAKEEFDVLSSVNRFIEDKFSDLSQEELKMVEDTVEKSLNQLTRSAVEANQTNNLTPFIEELDVIMSDSDYDLVSLHNRIIRLEEEATERLTEEELTQLFAGSTVAYYTLEYWQDYSKEQGDTTRAASDFSWKQVGKVDVATAVGVATGEGIYMLIAGPIGWKAFVASVVGGAIGGSVTDAILQIW
jgi:hypothetical protein